MCGSLSNRTRSLSCRWGVGPTSAVKMIHSEAIRRISPHATVRFVGVIGLGGVPPSRRPLAEGPLSGMFRMLLRGLRVRPCMVGTSFYW